MWIQVILYIYSLSSCLVSGILSLTVSISVLFFSRRTGSDFLLSDVIVGVAMQSRKNKWKKTTTS